MEFQNDSTRIRMFNKFTSVSPKNELADGSSKLGPLGGKLFVSLNLNIEYLKSLEKLLDVFPLYV